MGRPEPSGFAGRGSRSRARPPSTPKSRAAADRAPCGGATPMQPLQGAAPFARRCSPPPTD